MRTVRKMLVAGLGMWAGLAAPAAADDAVDLLQKTAPAPNVLVILDTSQSMTWFDKDGNTIEDENPGISGLVGPSRISMAKTVLSNVITNFSAKVNFGLASYQQGDVTTNVAIKTAAAPPAGAWYYSEGWSGVPFDWVAFNFGSRYYLKPGPGQFDVNVPNVPFNATTFKPQFPSFWLRWKLTGGPTRVKLGGQPFIPDQGHLENKCKYHKEISWDNKATWGWYSGYTYAGTPPSPPCPPGGAITGSETSYGSITKTRDCTFSFKKTWDDPKPYVYHCVGKTNGSANGEDTDEQFQNDPGPYSYTYFFQGAYWLRDNSDGQENIWIVDVPGQPFIPDRYYWVYSYAATCAPAKPGCLNNGNFWGWTWSTLWYPDDATCKAGLVTTDPFAQPTSLSLPGGPTCGGWPGCTTNCNGVDPGYTSWAPTPTGVWDFPFDWEYKWQGNNYQLVTEGSCNPGDGAKVLVNVGSGNLKPIKNYLGTATGAEIDASIRELHAANLSTPLAGALDKAKTYFTEADAVQKDAQKDCRKNYIILVTDGGESCLLHLTQPGKKAAALAALSNPLGGVKTYVVGIDQGGLSVDEDKVLTDIAKEGGTGLNTDFKASNPAELTDALNSVIGAILSQQYAFANPVLPLVRRVDNLVLLESTFKTPASPPEDPNTPWWPGELKAEGLEPDGKIIPTPTLFEAGAKLAARPWADRTVFTKPPGASGLVKFKEGDFDPYLGELLGAGDPAALRDLVRGNNGKTFKLGDIFHSTPAVMGSPNPAYVDRTFDGDLGIDPNAPPKLLSLADEPDTFAAYRDANKTRTRIALVGANDGMLHAFNAGEVNAGKYELTADKGKEEWGFIPTQMLSKLHYLGENNGHKYYVDGSPRTADVWLDDNNDGKKASNEWHAVVVGGFREGGSGLYALDITNTKSPKFLWNYDTTGDSWSEPVFARVRAQMAAVPGKRVDRWVVVVGDGYSTGATGKALHIIDIKTGKALFKYSTTGPVAAAPLVVDVNGDGYADRVYVGTLDGKMLRCDISAVAQKGGGAVDPATDKMADNWTCTVMFQAPPGQPIYTAAAGIRGPANEIWIFFASGDRSKPLIVPGTPYRLYGMKDPGTAKLTEGDLADVTDNNTLKVGDLGAKGASGWFLKLRSDGEKVFGDAPLTFGSQVLFSTFRPVPVAGGGCGDVGSSAIYSLYFQTGGGTYDQNQFALEWKDRTAAKRIIGEYAGSTGKPVITLGAQATGWKIYAGNSGSGTKEAPIGGPPIPPRKVYWRIVP